MAVENVLEACGGRHFVKLAQLHVEKILNYICTDRGMDVYMYMYIDVYIDSFIIL